MVRASWVDKNGIKKGAWSAEEDRKLQAHIIKYGHQSWRKLPTFAGLKRCGKSCRLRWLNYLRPDLKHGNYTKAEEDLIIQLHQQHGNRWAMIASKLPGRSDNEIKNYWHTHLKKRVIRPLKPANNHKRWIDYHMAESDTSGRKNPVVLCGDQIQFQILESWPLSSSEKLAPSSTTATTGNVDISQSHTFNFDFDDGGLEEMLNSSELFAEMSSLISQYEGESVGQETPITVDDISRELLEDDGDFWNLQPFSEMHNNEVELSAPCTSYFNQSFIDGLFFDQTIHQIYI